MTRPATLPLDVFTCPLDGTTLIEASAGTGKTWAITGLVLRQLLEQGHPVQNVLVVTFTQAATAELRERIRERLQETLLALRGWQADGVLPTGGDPFVPGLLRHLLAGLSGSLPDTLVADRLQAALAAFDEAPILTIHGYCQRALGDAAFSAGQPFEQEPVDDAALLGELVGDFWRRKVIAADLPAARVNWLVRKLPPALLVRQLRRRLSRPRSELLWPEVPVAQADAGTGLEACWAALRDAWAAHGADAGALLQAAIAGKQLNGQTYKAAKIEAGQQAWTQWFAPASRPLENPPEPCRLWSAERLKPNKGQTAPTHPLFEQFQQLFGLLDAADAGHEHFRLDLLRDWLAWAPDELQRRKRSRRQVSFDDLLLNLDNALRGAGGDVLAGALQQRFPVALIDEFQDTDPVQFGIFRRIYIDPPAGPERPAGSALFLVGDPKQAIYSFRQADLQTYLQARAHAGRHFHLADNQRSSAELIAAINALFSQHAAPFMLDGLDFQPVGLGAKPRAVLEDRREEAGGALVCWALPMSDGEALDKAEARRRVTQACAAEIASLLDGAAAGSVSLLLPDGRRRPLVAGDIAVLVRTHDQGKRIKAALAAQGLGAAELSSDSVFASAEAAELERLLLALAEPGRPERLRTALATLPGGLDALALAHLADASHEGQEAGQGMSDWLQQFQLWHQHWAQRGLVSALHRVFESRGVAARLLALPEGERRLTNMLHLVELLHAEEQAQGRVNPPALLRWFARQRQDERADEVAQLRLESDEKLVRIVTIHRSKGLEYPLVFCPFIWEGPGRARAGLEGAEYPSSVPGGPRRLDFRATDLPEVAAGLQAAAIESASEDLRLLYVALTRAVHRCYLVCGPYRSSRSTRESQRALLNWLVAGGGDLSPAAWLDQGGDLAAITGAWANLSGAAPAGSIRCRPLPENIRRQALAVAASLPLLHSRPRPEGLAAVWRLDSFTGLLRGWHDNAPVADHDARAVRGPSVEALADDVDIVRFARGARAGECLHAVFEWADFSDPATWDSAIQRALLAHPLPETRQAGASLSARQLSGMLADVLNTPLPSPHGPAFTLSAVNLPARVSELEFSLPVGRLQAADLLAACRTHGLVLPPLAFQPLQGYLRGFIDLVFRVPGTHAYALLDWKSNHLGEQREDYLAGPMSAEMAAHAYSLQALIYALALHRHLRNSLPAYDYQTHFGGAYYLFVRGVRPAWAVEPVAYPAMPPGVVHWRPPLALLDTLDALLEGSV